MRDCLLEHVNTVLRKHSRSFILVESYDLWPRQEVHGKSMRCTERKLIEVAKRSFLGNLNIMVKITSAKLRLRRQIFAAWCDA